VLEGETEFEATDGAIRCFGEGDVLLFADTAGIGDRGRPVRRPLRVAFVPLA
jgi:hypothetical protein